MKTSSEFSCTRREFFARAAGVAAVALAGGYFEGCALKPVGPPSSGTTTVNLSNPKYAALLSPGGAMKVPWKSNELPIIVRCRGTGVYEAYSSSCPHAGCEVTLPDASGIIDCNCHGSEFNADGQLLRGPARSNLYPASSVSLSGNTLTITFG